MAEAIALAKIVMKVRYLRAIMFDLQCIQVKPKKMAETKPPVNAPSTTGNPSGGGRGNNPPKPKK